MKQEMCCKSFFLNIFELIWHVVQCEQMPRAKTKLKTEQTQNSSFKPIAKRKKGS